MAIKTGIIGCGKVGKMHADVLRNLPGSNFTAVYDSDENRTASFAQRYGVIGCSSIAEMAAKGVEMVSICTPHPLHAVSAVEAAEYKMNILIEKPLASTLKDCDTILDAAAKNRVQIGTVYQRRFYEPVLRIRHAIDKGKLGVPIIGNVSMIGWRDKAYYDSDPWRGTWKGEGGGVLVTQATHQLDLLIWFMGDIKEVYGIEANLNHPYIEVEDTAVAVIKFKNGGIGNMLVTNSANPALYGKVHIHGSNGASVGVQTDGGAMFIAGMTNITEPPLNDIWTVPGEEKMLDIWRQEDTEHFNSIDSVTYYHARQIEDFLKAMNTGERPLITGEDGRKTVALFSAIYEATKIKKPIRL